MTENSNNNMLLQTIQRNKVIFLYYKVLMLLTTDLKSAPEPLFSSTSVSQVIGQALLCDHVRPSEKYRSCILHIPAEWDAEEWQESESGGLDIDYWGLGDIRLTDYHQFGSLKVLCCRCLFTSCRSTHIIVWTVHVLIILVEFFALYVIGFYYCHLSLVIDSGCNLNVLSCGMPD